MSPRWCWAIPLLTVAAFGCGGSGVRYSGESRTPRVEPAALAASDGAPPEHQRLGDVSAACTRIDPAGGFDGEHPGDIACSRELLLAGLRERASRAGGSLLVDVACEPSADSSARHVECSAQVWASSAPPGTEPAPLPTLGGPLTPAFGVVEDYWRVSLDFWPADGAPRRAPVGSEQVSEIDFPRSGQVRLGDVRARAKSDVSAGTLRSALLAVAARIGATSVVGVRCIEADGERSCVASVAAAGVVELAGESAAREDSGSGGAARSRVSAGTNDGASESDDPDDDDTAAGAGEAEEPSDDSDAPDDGDEAPGSSARMTPASGVAQARR